MSEHYTDLFSTTVSNSGSGYTAGSGSLHVTSTTGLTASCTVVIMTQALPSTVKALLHVTSVTSGTVLAVTSEGTDNNALDGDFVYAVISSRAIDAIKADILASVPANGPVLLEAHTASSSSTLDFTTFYSSTYDDYEFRMLDIIPATNNVNLLLTYSTNGGSSYSATGYTWANSQYGTSADYSSQGSNSDTSIRLGIVSTASNTAAGGGFSYVIRFVNPGGTTNNKSVYWTGRVFDSNGFYYASYGTGNWGTTTAVNAVRFAFSSGNIATGVIRCYGIPH